jgi:hypothetical protein
MGSVILRLISEVMHLSVKKYLTCFAFSFESILLYKFKIQDPTSNLNLYTVNDPEEEINVLYFSHKLFIHIFLLDWWKV